MNKLNPNANTNITITNKAPNREVYISNKAIIYVPPSSRLFLYAPITIGPDVVITLAPNSALHISRSQLEGQVTILTHQNSSQILHNITIHCSSTGIQIVGANTLKNLTIGSNCKIYGSHKISAKASNRITAYQRSFYNIFDQEIIATTPQNIKLIEYIRTSADPSADPGTNPNLKPGSP